MRKNENDETFARGQHYQDMLDNLLSVQSVHQDSTTSNATHCAIEVPSFNGINLAIVFSHLYLLTYLLTYCMPCALHAL